MRVTLTSGDLDVTASKLPSDDFPMDQTRDLREQFTATLSGADVAAIARVADAMSSEMTRYYLNGVRLKSVDATTIQAQATDGHRLYLADITLPDAKGELGPNVIIPRKAVRLLVELARSVKDGVSLIIGSPAPTNEVTTTAPAPVNASRLRIALAERAAEVTLTATLIDGTYPDVARVIPKGGDKQALFKIAELRRAMSAVSGHSRTVRATKLTFDAEGTVTVSAAYVDSGLAVKVKVACEHNAPGFEIGYNGEYLASLLTSAQGEEILFTLTDPSAPALVRNPADTAWSAVIMPMRVS
ncbi:hypothetical protein [Sphingomonas aerophila]|uniref:Beta sliding clamp n=1 Tax=Sphingomonas aerophila TaxID=1344948 RepID=A0A7W9BCP9_9SPHN|nr:DNA polymerase-3 subunit beta [Sphingomonas aerophila]